MRLKLTKKKLIILICIFSFAFLILISALFIPKYRIIINPSNSLPKGLYLHTPFKNSEIKIQTILYFSLDSSLKLMLKDRLWFPQDIPLMKKVYALPGDSITFDGKEVFINGKLFGLRLDKDSEGKKIPWLIEGTIVLLNNQYFVGSSRLDSFDSRYFGPVQKEQILGICYPLWTE